MYFKVKKAIYFSNPPSWQGRGNFYVTGKVVVINLENFPEILRSRELEAEILTLDGVTRDLTDSLSLRAFTIEHDGNG